MIEHFKKAGFSQDITTNIWTLNDIANFQYNDGDEIENYLLSSLKNVTDLSVSSGEGSLLFLY